MTYKLYIDIDGVMGDIIAAIMRLYPKANVVNPGVYSLDKMFDNVPLDILKRSELYNADNFRLYPFVVQTLRRFESLGFNIEFITARPIELTPATERTIDQVKFFGNYNISYGFQSTEQKLSYVVGDLVLNSQIKHAWFIEDNPDLVSATYLFNNSPIVKEADRLTLMMYLQPYNSYSFDWTIDALIKPIMNWQHFYNKVIERAGT